MTIRHALRGVIGLGWGPEPNEWALQVRTRLEARTAFAAVSVWMHPLGCFIAMTGLKGKTPFAGYYSNVRQTTIPSYEHALGGAPDWAGR